MTEIATAMPEDEIDLGRFLVLFWRRRRVWIAGALIAALPVLVFSLLQPRQWVAGSTVMVPESPPPKEQTQVVGGIQLVTPSVVYSQETYARLIKSAVLAEAVIRKLNLEITPAKLASAISARPIRDTRLIEIAVTAGQPAQAEAIANAIAEALADYDRQVISAELTQARRFVEAQLERARADLAAKEQALKEFNQRENLTELEANGTRRLNALTALRESYEQTRLDLGVASSRLAQVKVELTRGNVPGLLQSSAQSSDGGTSVTDALRAKLADLEVQRAALLAQLPRSRSSVQTLDAQIEEARLALALRHDFATQRAMLEVETAGLRAKERLLAQAIAREERAFQALNVQLAQRRAELNRLTREAETAKNVYTTLSTRATEAILAQGMKGGFVRVVDRAGAAPAPRGTVRRTIFGGFLGLVVGLVVALVWPEPRTAEHTALAPSRPRSVAGGSADADR